MRGRAALGSMPTGRDTAQAKRGFEGAAKEA